MYIVNDSCSALREANVSELSSGKAKKIVLFAASCIRQCTQDDNIVDNAYSRSYHPIFPSRHLKEAKLTLDSLFMAPMKLVAPSVVLSCVL